MSTALSLAAAQPAIAQAVPQGTVEVAEPFRYAVNGSVPARCAIESQFFSVAGQSGTAVTVGSGGTASVAIDTGNAGRQAIGSLGTRCNGGAVTVEIASQNGFRLRLGDGGPSREIPYRLAVEGTSLSTEFASDASYIEQNIGGGGVVRRSMFLNIGAVDPLSLFSGSYTDVIIISVTPNG